MGTILPDLFDSPAHRLALVLQATRSLIVGLTPQIQDQRSLRLLDFALLNAITDLEDIDTLPPGACSCTASQVDDAHRRQLGRCDGDVDSRRG